MDADVVVEIGRQGLYVAILILAPILSAALLIGLVIGMFQAATQIQEMTLSFIPKIIGIAVVMAISAPWILHQLVGFTRGLIERIPAMLH